MKLLGGDFSRIYIVYLYFLKLFIFLNVFDSPFWILNFPKALDYYEKSLKIKEKIHGKNSLKTANTLNNIGQIHVETGKIDLGLEYLKRSLNAFIESHGKDCI